MGRPINKSKMSGLAGAFGGNLSGKLAVTAYRPFGGVKVDSTTAYIVNQRGSKKFKIHLEDSSEVIMKLVAVAPGSLVNNDAGGFGQFCVQIILDDSTVAYVSKFHNRTVHYVTAAGATGSVKYSLGSEGSDQGAVANTGSIDVR
jgi:hypothetical protein